MKQRWEDLVCFVKTFAQELAYPTWYHECVDTVHVLGAMMRTRGCTANLIVGECGVHPTIIDREIQKRFPPGAPYLIMGVIPQTRRVSRLWDQARTEAIPMGYFGTEHILLAVLDDTESDASHILKHFDISKQSVADVLGKFS